ncbi:3-phosphoshikimate 1-carboxyvinyltransferase [Vulcaniibacterium thermophilum]|jgi:3-phosphoshikimate 1-carboxyvinyltransferase|uniref:3-phosphoshikimate 1-carboxyvinyltransferase n=1 Tax=Vulcaniibacterium thermophilum TaxID=1169913 RepID=A0A918YUV1_9GAMM|nr:3-phosphoshikimate 1-carboxyvinyltransferase [Vulcaniibacterium thermophilum]GHE25967.1 3-phosphoshikimate 1-carboxyvinyltransferase [Vulcaniibacterium thermophilum]
MTAWIARPGAPLRGRLRVPGDKSVSHRAIMLGALAEGVTRVRGFLEGEDTRATARVFERLGVRIETPDASERIVRGVGLRGLRPPAAPLDCGNAGTGMRLLAGVLAAQPFDSVLIGDASLSRRPMGRVIDPLSRMGALIEAEPGGLPPLRIRGGRALRGIEYATPVASAQVKSALLLAGLYAQGETVVREPHPTRDYTERMLAAFGWPIEFAPGFARIAGGHRLRATEVDVPADFSSAAFFLVAGSVIPGSDLTLEAVGMNPRRTGLLDVLRAMGADIEQTNRREQGGEPVADLVVRHAPLHGIEVPVDRVPDMIDEFPALFVAAACAEGVTVVRGAAELRVKESDRIAVMAEGLRALGCEVEEAPDGARIVGTPLRGGAVHSRGDHRIAMSFAIAAQRAAAPVRIDDVDNVATSFPGFDELARRAGLALEPAL